MNATQPSRPPLRSLPPTQRTQPRSRRQPRPSQRRPHRAIAIELSTKLSVNVLLSIAALSALVQLLPHNMTQQARLQELQTEVTLVENRVAHLQTQFNRYFDPRQSMSVMQEESNRIAPGQRQIVWTSDPDSTQSSQFP